MGGVRNPLREVMWEKKAVDTTEGIEPVEVDDLILIHHSGTWRGRPKIATPAICIRASLFSLDFWLSV